MITVPALAKQGEPARADVVHFSCPVRRRGGRPPFMNPNQSKSCSDIYDRATRETLQRRGTARIAVTAVKWMFLDNHRITGVEAWVLNYPLRERWNLREWLVLPWMGLYLMVHQVQYLLRPHPSPPRSLPTSTPYTSEML